MPLPSTLDLCKHHLFTPESDLPNEVSPVQVAHLLRLREMYTWYLSNPDCKDKEFIDQLQSRHNLSRSAAYADLALVKSLLPLLGQASRDFHRWRFNEMILETYQMAKKRKDTKTMERAATSYAKYNRVDLEDEQAVPYDEIVPQPFTATSDPSPLGIKPLPNLQEKIHALIKEFAVQYSDIEDVEWEEVDLEENVLFAPAEEVKD